MTTRYHLKNIRILLTEGFSAEELRRFCYDDTNFRPVYHQLAHNTGKTEIVEQLLAFAEQTVQIEALLTWAKTANPRRYSTHQPYVEANSGPAFPGPTPNAVSIEPVRTGQPGPRGYPQTDITPPTEIKKRYALLIGVRDYTASHYRSLPHTIPDVVELDKLLRAAGYTTRLLHSDLPGDQPTRARIWGELKNLAQSTSPGDLLLVYFGGHGDLDETDKAYLIPCDLYSRSALNETAINLDDFTQTLSRAGAQAKILILDACHSGIGRSGGRMTDAFARHVFFEAAGMATLAACRQGEVAYEHDQSQHGAFTYYLLEGLRGAADEHKKGFVSFNDVNQYVTDKVKDWAIEQRKGLQQWPNASAKLVGDPPLLTLTIPPNPISTELLPNPFTATLAIHQPEQFIGRNAELRRLQSMLQGGSVSLLGEPKIGKSSLLLALARTWSGQVFGPLDCHTLTDREDFYACLAAALGLPGSNWQTELRPALLQVEALLLLDEFDVAASLGLTHQDLARFRSVCAANPPLKLLTASRRPLKQIFPDTGTGSPAYNFLPPLTLGPLTEAEARHLLNHPWANNALSFETAAQAELLALTVRHPFKLQRAAFHRYESLTDSGYDWKAAYQFDVENML